MSEFFADTDLSLFQHTLTDSVVFMGRGLNSGLRAVMTVMPAPANSGIEFIRRDITECDNIIKARWDAVSDTDLSTTVANRFGIRVSGVDHLLAAFAIAGIDNAQVVIDIPEVPIMDGSAQPFLEQFAKIGTVRQAEERMAIVIDEPVSIASDCAEASFAPSLVPMLELSVDLPKPLVGNQRITLPVSGTTMGKAIGSARIFGFEEQLIALKRRGFAQGSSSENMVMVDQQGIIQEELRFADEFVRHECLSTLADLTLTGHCIIGHFRGDQTRHTLNNRLLRKLLNSQKWHFSTLRAAHQIWLKNIKNPSLRA